ncbi:MAG: threonine/homoserine/homoserine lactone efflux protein [Gammaproteobacteria bacterium]|jgi:threonine/homoserine/homoserine lactone efflux protein
MLLASGLNFGARASLPHLLGICLGFPVMILLIGLGFGALFAAYPVLHDIIKVAGLVYLLHLAWRIGSARQQSASNTPSKPLNFWQSALFQWVNPKGWIMGSSALATFTSLENNFFTQVVIVAFVFFLVSIPSTASWLFFGAGLQRYLRQPEYLRAFNIGMALLLVVSIFPVISELLSRFNPG